MVQQWVRRVSRAGVALLVCTMPMACTACASVNPVVTSPEEPAFAAVGSLDAAVRIGYRAQGGVWSAEVHIPEDGGATVRFDYWNAHLPAFDPGVKPSRIGSISEAEEREIRRRFDEKMIHAEQQVCLDERDRRMLLATMERSGFFGEWPVPERITDQDSWWVTVRCGEREKSRAIYAQPEFREAERVLWRVIHQAVGEWALAAGRRDILDDLLRDGAYWGLLHRERFPASAGKEPPK